MRQSCAPYQAGSGAVRLALGVALATATLLCLPPCWEGDTARHTALAASALEPRRTGLEPPDSPRSLGLLPGGPQAGRTAEGGMGYTDAYGNTLTQPAPEAAARRDRRQRARDEAAAAQARHSRPLPDPQQQTPVWSFR